MLSMWVQSSTKRAGSCLLRSCHADMYAILHLMGLYLYQLDVFLYCTFFIIGRGMTVLMLLIRGPAKWKRISRVERLVLPMSEN